MSRDRPHLLQQAQSQPSTSSVSLKLVDQFLRSSCRKRSVRLFFILSTVSYMSVALMSHPRIIPVFLSDDGRGEGLSAPSSMSMHSSSGDNGTGLHRWYLTNVTLRQSSVFQSEFPTCHVWPDQQPHNDRIEHQLLMRPKKAPKQEKLILLSMDSNTKNKPAMGRSVFQKHKCPVSACRITYDFKRANESAAIVFKDYVNPLLVEKHIYQRPTNQIWALTLLESPHYTADFAALNGHINWTATYRQDSELVTPYEKFVLYDPKVLRRKQAVNYAERKKGRKKVAWFVSNCQTSNDRMKYATELAKYIDVDIFGSCGPHKCNKKSKKCQEILQRDYKFYLSFENSNCLWYITEKLWFPLQNDVLPIVMGAPRAHYEAIAPHKSFIHVSDFHSPKEMADYLHKLDQKDEEYNSYFEWKDTGELIDTRFYCRLCALLHADDMPSKTYRDLDSWWAGAQVCEHKKKLNPVIMDQFNGS